MADVREALLEAARRDPAGLHRLKRDPSTRGAALTIEARVYGRSTTPRRRRKR